ncbi:hypothetical protein [Paracoccus siganidrum]|nr:hypothetical protein [Paracoccus siganidrum]RMC30085.1 hypothetical protein C9E82_18905 [Paracoccus siganidrum]
MRILTIMALLALTACDTPTTAEGCPIGLTDIGMAQTRACQQAFHEEMARQRGGTVTRCIGGTGNVSCTTY